MIQFSSLVQFISSPIQFIQFSSFSSVQLLNSFKFVSVLLGYISGLLLVFGPYLTRPESEWGDSNGYGKIRSIAKTYIHRLHSDSEFMRLVSQLQVQFQCWSSVLDCDRLTFSPFQSGSAYSSFEINHFQLWNSVKFSAGNFSSNQRQFQFILAISVLFLQVSSSSVHLPFSSTHFSVQFSSGL